MVTETATAESSWSVGARSCRVREREGAYGRRFVQISGLLPIGWFGSLSQGMAEVGLSIERGHAARVGRQRWEIDLELQAGTSRSLPGVDYLELATRGRAQAPRPIVIEDHVIARYAERGALVLDVKGVDCLGFLASLLDRLTGLLLFPIELEIETIGTHAVDRLVLQTLGGKEPPPEAASVLADLLDGLRPARGATSGRLAGRAPVLRGRERGLDC